MLLNFTVNISWQVLALKIVKSAVKCHCLVVGEAVLYLCLCATSVESFGDGTLPDGGKKW